MFGRASVIGLALMFLDCTGELVVDTGDACLIPEGAACSYGYSGAPDGDCTLGDVPDGAQLEVVVFNPGTGHSWDIECSAEIVGERELEISGSFRWKPDQEHDGEPPVIANCTTPPLSAGEWTIRYGTATAKAYVPSQDVEAACLSSVSRFEADGGL